MSQGFVLQIVKEGIFTAFKISGPILLVAIVIGLLVSILQATTQIQEQTLTFVPKLLGVAVVGIFLGTFMMDTMIGFTQKIFEIIMKL